jgi:hypothetical protein
VPANPTPLHEQVADASNGISTAMTIDPADANMASQLRFSGPAQHNHFPRAKKACTMISIKHS